MFARFMEGENPTEFSFAEKLDFLAQGVLSGKIFEMARPANVSLWRELAQYFSQPAVKTAIARQTADDITRKILEAIPKNAKHV